MSRVAGRLTNFIDNWLEITKDAVILNAISGYRIPFLRTPPPRPRLKEPELSEVERKLCAIEINRLLAKGAIQQAVFTTDQYLSSYFLIDKSSGKKRFILNLKSLNKFVFAPHFKMEDLKTAIRLISPNCFMATIDLEDSYLLVPVNASHRKYLRFSFQGKIFEFCALPFGLSSAPYIFTKLLKPLAATLREKGFLSIIYLDDFLLVGDTLQECNRNVEETLRLLDSLGFVVNFQKCELNPSRERKFLGFTLNSSKMEITLPEEKRLTIIERLKRYSVKQSCKIRDFASLIETLNSICCTIPYGSVYMKNFERQKFLACVDSKDNYDARMRLCPTLQADFQWWLHKLQSPPISKSLITRGFTYEIFSDASLTGWGASMGKENIIYEIGISTVVRLVS